MKLSTPLHDKASAVLALSRLHQQADTLDAGLQLLRLEIQQLQHYVDRVSSHALQEANEQLVLATIHAETVAETAVSDLDEMTRTSQLDPLTGTPNRGLMLDRLRSAMLHAQRHSSRIAVLFLDLDHFKEINDTYGHAVGDQVIQLVTQCIQSALRASDTVSRHGGDEFLILLTDISTAAQAEQVANKIQQALRNFPPVETQAIAISASIGIAIYPEDGENETELINQADTAMYIAKQNGGGYCRPPG
jgi:diguanylate cyclase